MYAAQRRNPTKYNNQNYKEVWCRQSLLSVALSQSGLAIIGDNDRYVYAFDTDKRNRLKAF